MLHFNRELENVDKIWLIYCKICGVFYLHDYVGGSEASLWGARFDDSGESGGIGGDKQTYCACTSAAQRVALWLLPQSHWF